MNKIYILTNSKILSINKNIIEKEYEKINLDDRHSTMHNYYSTNINYYSTICDFDYVIVLVYLNLNI